MSQNEEQKPTKEHSIVDNSTPQKNLSYYLDAHIESSAAAVVELYLGKKEQVR